MSLRFLHPLLLLVSTYSAYAEFFRNETAMNAISLGVEGDYEYSVHSVFDPIAGTITGPIEDARTIPLTGTINFSDDGGPAGDYSSDQSRSITFDAGEGNLIVIRVNAFDFEFGSAVMYDYLGIEYSTDGSSFDELNDTVAPTVANWLYHTSTTAWKIANVALSANFFGGYDNETKGNGGGWLFGEQSTVISPDDAGNTYPANAIGTWHTINARAVRFHFRSDFGTTFDGWDIDIAQSLLVPDSDDDGLFDPVETNTGIYVDASDTGTDPNDNDTDDDGILDGVETNTGTFVDASDTGTNPNLADTSGDGLNDGIVVDAGFDPLIDYSNFIGAVAQAMLAAENNSGFATKEELPLIEQAGIDQVMANPANYDLVTSAEVTSLLNERPSQSDYDSVVAERDSRLTLEEVAELRPGSTMIEVSENQATVQLQMEESSDLQSWEDKGDPATMTIPADTDTKFFRFKMAE